MTEYTATLQKEKAYLNQTLQFIKSELDSHEASLPEKQQKIIASRKDMWDDTVHYVQDLEDLPDIYSYLSELRQLTAEYTNVQKTLDKYRKAVESPYFARMDITEAGYPNVDKVYIGITNIMDKHSQNVYVYDWRAPISGMFYQFELGSGYYTAPMGTIPCEIILKRQFKIHHSELKYFFDCSIAISDELLQDVLSRNASSKMRRIVETIQREQDVIIRDVETELLIVQGAAGSGKTSIALHRIAFLLYHGLGSNLNTSNFLIISPNDLLNQYISTVLPELGEENVAQATFESIAQRLFAGKLQPEGRSDQLEILISREDGSENELKRQIIEFKGSRTMLQILIRYLRHYARQLIPFEDVYYNGVILATRQQLKNRFLKNEIGIPLAKQLKKIESKLLEQVHPLQKARLLKIEKIVQRSEGHELEIKSFSRLLAIKEAKKFLVKIQKFTKIDYFEMYRILFADKNLFLRLSQGLELPQNIEEIITTTHQALGKEKVSYEDCAPLLYLMLKVEGCNEYLQTKQVVIDEAQDYYPMHYEVFKLLFSKANYTVLGDIHQAIEKQSEISMYDDIIKILDKDKALKLFLTKSYRSSYEINEFTQKLLGTTKDSSSFERHEAKPVIVGADSQASLITAMAHAIDEYLAQGYESIAVICKTQQDARKVHQQLSKLAKVKLVNTEDIAFDKGAIVISAYMAKGLEFDAVLVFEASADNYSSEFDRKLLYVACTRALHRLALYHTGEISKFIGKP